MTDKLLNELMEIFELYGEPQNLPNHVLDDVRNHFNTFIDFNIRTGAMAKIDKLKSKFKGKRFTVEMEILGSGEEIIKQVDFHTGYLDSLTKEEQYDLYMEWQDDDKMNENDNSAFGKFSDNDGTEYVLYAVNKTIKEPKCKILRVCTGTEEWQKAKDAGLI